MRGIRCREAILLLLLSSPAHAFDAARNAYLMRCGGCHGIEGISVPTAVPTLRDHVGTFLCTQEGRDYILHVPNVAMSRLDDALLADVLNFVGFDLGGKSTQPGTPKFTPKEVHEARAQPVAAYDRNPVLQRAAAACGRPGTLQGIARAHG